MAPFGRWRIRRIVRPIGWWTITEFDGEPVEQLGVAGPFPLLAEIVNRFDKSHAEQHLPHPIHGNARRQRIFR